MVDKADLRTAPQVDFPESRMEALIAVWRRSVGSSTKSRTEALSEKELDAMARAVLRLQRGLTGSRELAGSSYMDDPELLGAYLLYYWPSSYAQAKRALSVAGIAPKRVLDLGSGPGPMAAAALDAGAVSIRLIDKSEKALKLALDILEPADVRTERHDLENLPAGEPSDRFDLAIIGHALNELAQGREDRIERRADVAIKAAGMLAPGGSILMLDPATLAASRDALALRDRLVASGWTVLAPCSTQAPCPALGAGPNQSCHDEAAWNPPRTVRELAERAGLDRASVKMSWFALMPPDNTDAEPCHDGPEAYRVVSEAMLNKAGRVRRLICGPRGRFPLSARNGDPAAVRAGFFSLERYELLSIDNPEEREGGWGIAADTVLARGALP